MASSALAGLSPALPSDCHLPLIRPKIPPPTHLPAGGEGGGAQTWKLKWEEDKSDWKREGRQDREKTLDKLR